MSCDLVWLLTRNNSSFLVKQNNACFSREPLNLTNQHSFKFSQLANSKSLSIATNNQLSLKKQKNSNKPSSSVYTFPLTKTFGTHKKHLVNLVKQYRPDLTPYALKRLRNVKESQKQKPEREQKRRVRKSAKSQ